MTRKKLLKTILLTTIFACNIGIKYASAVDIGNEAVNTSTLSTNDTITFTSSSGGILNYDDSTITTLSTISTDNNSVGTLQISYAFDNLIIDGDIGSATKKINSISFLDSGVLEVSGSIYVDSITADINYYGELLLVGDNSSIQASIGGTDYQIGAITVNAENVTFSGDIYVGNFDIISNKSAIISGTTNVMENLTMYSASTLTINTGSQMETTSTATLRGTLNIGISSSSSSSPAILISGGTGSVADGTALYFDYSDATNISTSNTYKFINSSDGDVTVTPSTLTVTDNSLLLTSAVSQEDSKSLSLTTSVDTSTTSQLTSKNLSTLNLILDSGNSSVQTSLFQLSTQSALDDALSSLQLERNNMVQMVSFDITNQINNIIDNRAQSINLHNKNKSDATTASDNATKMNGLWGNIFGNRAIQGTLGGEEGYKSSTGGVVFGFDKVKEIKDHNSTIGGTFAYANGFANSGSVSGQKISIDSYQLSLYNHNANLNGLGFYNLNSVNVAYNQYGSARTIKVGSYQTAEADFSAIQYGAKSSVGYNFKAGKNFILSPNVGLKYSGISLAKYSETGAGDAGLNVENSYFDFISSEAGLKLVGNLSKNLETQLSTGWSHNFNNNGAIATTSLVGDSGTTQRVIGVDILQNVYDFGAQLNIKTGEDKKLMLVYNLQKGNKFTNNVGSLQYVWGF